MVSVTRARARAGNERARCGGRAQGARSMARIRHRGQVFRGYGGSFRKLETLSGFLIRPYRSPHNHRRERERSLTRVALAPAEVRVFH